MSRIYWGVEERRIRGYPIDLYLIICPDRFCMQYTFHKDGPVFRWWDNRETVENYSRAMEGELSQENIGTRGLELENKFEQSKLEKSLDFLAENSQEDIPEWQAREYVELIAEKLGLPPFGNLGL